jgi:hypothetical protein
VRLCIHAVFPGGALHRNLDVFREYGSALQQVITLQGVDGFLGEGRRLLEHRPIFKLERHPFLSYSIVDDLEQITLCHQRAIDRAQREETVK